jgi:hypothetical protein
VVVKSELGRGQGRQVDPRAVGDGVAGRIYYIVPATRRDELTASNTCAPVYYCTWVHNTRSERMLVYVFVAFEIE